MSRLLLAALLTLLCACPAPESEPVPVVPEDPGPWPITTGLSVTDVVVNQGVEIALQRDGEPVAERNAPVVAGRPLLVRVAVATDFLWNPREVRAELTLLQPDGTSDRRDQVVFVDEDGDLLDPDTTLHFRLAATDVLPGTRFAVSFWATRDLGQDGDPVAWPAYGETAPLLADDAGGLLRVWLLPVRYTADGSDRLPDTSPEQIRLLEETLAGMLPVRAVELSVLDPIETTEHWDSGGASMGALLSHLRDLRENLHVPWDTYLYALVSPRNTWGGFCNLGCTAGISYRPTNPINDRLRVSVGLGFTGVNAAYVMVHELGHAHDRGHAPCGNAGNVDPDFPYVGGWIGTRGYDVVNDVHYGTVDAYDVMGYCDPDWVSDYTYAAVHERMGAVEGLRDEHSARAVEDWTAIDVFGGEVRKVHPTRSFAFTPEGDRVDVELPDGRTVEGWRVPMTHIDGATIFVPGAID